MEETLAPTTDNARRGRFLGGFRRRLAARLGPRPGFNELQKAHDHRDWQFQAFAAVAEHVAGKYERGIDEVCAEFGDDFGDEEFAVTAAARAVAAAVAAAGAAATAARVTDDVDRLRVIAKDLHGFVLGVRNAFEAKEDHPDLDWIQQWVETELAELDRPVVPPPPAPPVRAISNRAMLRCRISRARRTRRRASTKKTAATSTGDPDPEPSGDARARLRSVVGLIEAACVGGAL